MKIILKLTGLVIALAALGYRIFCAIDNYDSITMEWGKYMVVFWLLYIINLVCIATPFTRGWLTVVLSYAVVSVSMLLLCLDGIIYVAKLFDPSDRTMTEMGYYPVVHLLNCISGGFSIFGFMCEKRRDGNG